MSRFGFGLPTEACNPDTGVCDYRGGVNSFITPAGWSYEVVNIPQFVPLVTGGGPNVPDNLFVPDTEVTVQSGPAMPGPFINPTISPVSSSPTITDTDFISSLYQAYYKRQPDPPGLAWWVGRLQSGADTRASAQQKFATSPDMSPDPAKTLPQYLAQYGITPAQTVSGVPVKAGTTAAAGVSSQTLLLIALGVGAFLLFSGSNK